MNKKRMLILVNKELEICKEKLAVQIGHVVSTYLYFEFIKPMSEGKDVDGGKMNMLKEYMENENQGKILLACPKEKLLKLEKNGYISIRDAGLTELEPNTLTCVMYGVYDSFDRPTWTNSLKLYKDEK